MDRTKYNGGIAITVIAYIIWGFLPIYWHAINNVSSKAILAERVVWSFAFIVILIIFTNNVKPFVKTCKMILTDWKKLIGIIVASLVISLNWLTYIWAVNSEYVVQASLGYYINPLINILLGVLVLNEKLTKGQLVAFILASIGVLTITLNLGVFPWVSFVLAITFAIYGLLKKSVHIHAMFGLAIETMIITPIAFIYILLHPPYSSVINGEISFTSLLLVGSGLATALPLLLFAYGAKKIPFTMLGFLQYIAPTIMLFIGVFLFKEEFSVVHFISFIFIWIALGIYMMTIRRVPERKKLINTLDNRNQSSI